MADAGKYLTSTPSVFLILKFKSVEPPMRRFVATTKDGGGAARTFVEGGQLQLKAKLL
jgi:hypothetical protein